MGFLSMLKKILSFFEMSSARAAPIFFVKQIPD